MICYMLIAKKKTASIYLFNTNYTNCTDVEKKTNNNTIIIIYIYIYIHTILLIKQYVNFYLSIYIYIKGIC